MATLDIKLLRDLRRMWAQSLAIAFVVAGGVASLVMAVGSLNSLEETRTAYYDRYQFADVFATARRAPKTLLNEIAAIPGVAAAEGRIVKLALLDIPEFAEPATGEFISLPEGSQPRLNQPYLRSGRLPRPTSADEVVVTDGFAKAHGFLAGSRFSAILNGRKRELAIVGTAFSPEFIYATGPGDRMPDDRRFAIVWMAEKALAAAYDLDGAFSAVSLKLLRGASEPEVIKRLDALLDPYGGQAAYGRRDQYSDAYINHGLEMQRSMSWTLPPIFLLVAAFLINLTLSRIVALEREQIGLFKALGYANHVIALHYIKLVAVIVAIGIVLGAAAGYWLGAYVTRLYGDIVHFPFLIFAATPSVYLVARRAQPRCRHRWRSPRAARHRGSGAGRRDAATRTAALPPRPAGSLVDAAPAIAALSDDDAQHHGPSLARHFHHDRPFALDRHPLRLAVPGRHHGKPDRCHVLYGRPPRRHGELGRAA